MHPQNFVLKARELCSTLVYTLELQKIEVCTRDFLFTLSHSLECLCPRQPWEMIECAELLGPFDHYTFMIVI